MKTLSSFLVFVMFTVIFIRCDNDNDPTNNVCEENYVTTAITDAFSLANGYVDVPELMEAEIQEYKIQINANGEICSIGYQNPSAYTGEYQMLIIKNSDSVYSAIHTFSQSGLEYQSISPVVVSSGDTITVRRSVALPLMAINHTAGRVLMKSNSSVIAYPITAGNVTFLSSKFYGELGSWAANLGGVDYYPNDKAIPYIGLGFKVD